MSFFTVSLVATMHAINLKRRWTVYFLVRRLSYLHTKNSYRANTPQQNIRYSYLTQCFPFWITNLNLSVPALYLEIRAIDRGTDKVSSQRFSYFGSLAMGEEGDDGACAK